MVASASRMVTALGCPPPAVGLGDRDVGGARGRGSRAADVNGGRPAEGGRGVPTHDRSPSGRQHLTVPEKTITKSDDRAVRIGRGAGVKSLFPLLSGLPLNVTMSSPGP
jgi:hypothetical protein